MLFKNAVKILSSNFNVVWKHLVYVVITLVCTVPLIFAFSGPLIELLEVSGWVQKTTMLFSSIYTDPLSIWGILREVCLSFFTLIFDNLASVWFSVLGLVVSFYVIPNFLFGLGAFNVSSIMDKRMTSLLSVGYTQNFVSSLKNAAKYSGVRLLVKIPFDVIKVFLVVTMFRLASSFFVTLLVLSLLSAVIILVTSLEIVTLSGFAPSMIENNANVFRCFGKGVLPIFKNFMRVFASVIVLYLVMLFINVILGIATVGSALLVTLPASYVTIAIFGNVAYYTMTSKRYYLNPQLIVNPAVDDDKVEFRVDNIN